MVNGVDDAVVANAHLPAMVASTTAATATTTTGMIATASAAATDDAEPMTRCDCNNVVVVPPPTASQSSQSQTGVASAFPIVSIWMIWNHSSKSFEWKIYFYRDF